MTCESTELDLLAYLTGELDEAEAAHIRDHLATCSACAAEAEELRAVTQHLSTQMKEIPPALDIPPLVSARIERALKDEQRQTRKRSWLPGLGVVAAAAVVLISFGLRPDFAEKAADIPVLGAVASPFLQPDYDVQLAAAPASTAGAVGAVQRKEPNLAVTANGETVKVTRVEYRSNQTVLTYRAMNATLASGLRNLGDFAPAIEVGGRPVKLYRMTADQRGADVVYQVTLEAVDSAKPMTVRIKALPPTSNAAPAEPWTFTIN